MRADFNLRYGKHNSENVKIGENSEAKRILKFIFTGPNKAERADLGKEERERLTGSR